MQLFTTFNTDGLTLDPEWDDYADKVTYDDLGMEEFDLFPDLVLTDEEE